MSKFQSKDFTPDYTSTSSSSASTPTTKGDDLIDIHHQSEAPSYTDTIAAVTVAVLAVVLLLTLLIIFKALRKRQRARHGHQFDEIPTIAAGIMGAGVSAYSNIPVAGRVTWQPVIETTSASNRGDNSAIQNSQNSRSSQQSRSC